MTLSDEIDKMGKQLQLMKADNETYMMALRAIEGLAKDGELAAKIASSALAIVALIDASEKWLSDYPKSGLPVSDHVDRIDQPQ